MQPQTREKKKANNSKIRQYKNKKDVIVKIIINLATNQIKKECK